MPRDKHIDLPAMDQLIFRRVYKLTCRNLSYGIWDGRGEFLGIRYKMRTRFLDTEGHWDHEDFGTVSNAVDTGIDLPPCVAWDDRKAVFAFLDGIEEVVSKKE
jgi:hypothetical protein